MFKYLYLASSASYFESSICCFSNAVSGVGYFTGFPIVAGGIEEVAERGGFLLTTAAEKLEGKISLVPPIFNWNEWLINLRSNSHNLLLVTNKLKKKGVTNDNKRNNRSSKWQDGLKSLVQICSTGWKKKIN